MNEEGTFFKILICGLVCIMAAFYAIGNQTFPGEVESLLAYAGLILILALLGDDNAFTRNFPATSLFITIAVAIMGFVLSIFVTYQVICTIL